MYTLYKPDNLKESSSVFVLHGYTSNSTNIMNYSAMNSIAINMVLWYVILKEQEIILLVKLTGMQI